MNYLLILQIAIAREASLSFRSISLQPFAPNDPETNTILLDFNKLGKYKQDRINFVSVIGCELLNQKISSIQISQQPLVIINGISYFLLCSQTCNIQVLKILYAFSQSIYIHQKLLSELEINIQKIVQGSQTWDIKNYLYIVSKRFSQNQSQIKTSAQTKYVFELYDQYTENQNKKLVSSISNKQQNFTLNTKIIQKYFSEAYIINHMLISACDPSIIKQNLQQKYSTQMSRWYCLQAIVLGCEKYLGNHKWPAKQFQKMNIQYILKQLQDVVINNLQFMSFQILKNASHTKSLSNGDTCRYSKTQQQNTVPSRYSERQKDLQIQRQKQKQLEKQRQKLRQKQKQRIKILKNNVIEPFKQVQQTWLGRTQQYAHKYKQIKQQINKEFERIIQVSIQKSENLVYNEIEKVLQNQNTLLDIIGHNKFDGACLNFGNYIDKMKSLFHRMVQNNSFIKGWIPKDRPIKNKRDLLHNLQTRIEINREKQKIVQQALKLALAQQNHLHDILNIKNKKNQAEVFK